MELKIETAITPNQSVTLVVLSMMFINEPISKVKNKAKINVIIKTTYIFNLKVFLQKNRLEILE